MSETVEVLVNPITSETVEVLSSSTVVDVTEYPVTVVLSNDPGPQGPAGEGVPQGGATGEVLAKASGDDFDTEWVALPEPPVTSVDGRTGTVTLGDLYDPAGSAASAQTAAESYADSLAPNYDPAGAASAAQTAAESYADSLAPSYDPAGSASTAETNAKDYADLLAPNYDPAGAASAAQTAAESYADSLAPNYDPAGSASAAQTAAESYADSLAPNYDPAGAATTAETNAKDYADDTFVPYTFVGANNGVAQLDNDGKVPSNQLPAIAITDTFVVGSQSAMLALTAEVGDVAVRTDVSKSFILTAVPASTLGNWQELLTPPDTVTSVNSKTGAVTLSASDVGADPAGAAAAVTTTSIGAVPTTRTVNSKALSSDITLSASDVGADPAGSAAAITLSGLGGVPTTRTVNSKALSSDITLSASDVGADPAGSAAAVTTTSIGAVPTSRSVSTTSPLAGGGSLTGDLTLSVGAGTTSAAGVVQLEDSTSSTSTSKAATPNSVKSAYDLAAGKVATVGGSSPITTTGTTSVTVAINDASTSAKGAVQLEDSTSSTSTSKAATPNSVKSAYDLAAGKVASVSGTAPIASSGGTTPAISIADASTTGKGAVQLTDSTSSTSTSTAATPNSVKTTYDLANGKPSLGSATPLVAGTAAAGTAVAASHEDHVHPTDTTRAAALDEVIPTDPTGWYFSGSALVAPTGAVYPNNFVSAPDANVLDITGDLELQWMAANYDWSVNGTNNVFIAKYATGQRSWTFRHTNGAKTISLVWSTDGTATLTATSTANVPTNANGVKVTLDVDNGAAGKTAVFYTSTDYGTNWTQLGDPVTTAGTTSIFSGTAPLTIGYDPLSGMVLSANIRRAIVKNGIGGTTVFDADFTAVPADSFAFTESSSNAATVTLTTTRYRFGIPGVPLAATGTAALVANATYYFPLYVRGKSVTIKQYAFEITAAPSSATSFRVGIYAADSQMQPTGSILFSGDAISIPNSGTAIYRVRITPLTLSPGNYLVAVNTGANAPTVRTWTGNFATTAPNTLGANMNVAYRISETLSGAALPSTGTKWTTNPAANGLSYTIVPLGWS